MWQQGGLPPSLQRGLLFLQNIGTWVKHKSEVEVVDLVLKLREKLVSCLPPPPPEDCLSCPWGYLICQSFANQILLPSGRNPLGSDWCVLRKEGGRVKSEIPEPDPWRSALFPEESRESSPAECYFRPPQGENSPWRKGRERLAQGSLA